MWSFRTPRPDHKGRLLDAVGGAFTYAPVGVTRDGGPAPLGYYRDHTRTALGAGEATWDAALAALAAWETHAIGWLLIVPPRPAQLPGEQFVSVLRVGGVAWWAPCRIAYRIDERDRVGFAIGTIGSHPEAGEERFLVERDPSGAVTYDLLAISQPRHWAPRLFTRWTRHLQRRFAADSGAAMRRAVRSWAGR